MNLAEMNTALSGMDPTEVALGAGLIGVVGTLLFVGGAVWFFLSAIGYFKMFKKAGQRGWFAFIPFLREYGLFKMAWTVKSFVICTVLLGIVQFCAETESIIAGLLAFVSGIAWIVMQVKLVRRVAKSFGKGALWAVGLFFVPFITSMILGFGSAQYVGNPSVEKVL